jgi:dTDP-4-dehydrorhamnose reductase
MATEPIGFGGAKTAELSMVVIRSNGQKEDLGVVSKMVFNPTPIQKMIYKIKRALGMEIPETINIKE